MWRLPVALITLTCLLACSSAEADLPVNIPVPGADYLEQDIPPCTPVEGSGVEPCGVAPEVHSGLGDSITGTDAPFDIKFYMEGSFKYRDFGGRSHLVVRATYLPNTVRCTIRNSLEHPWRTPTYKSNSRIAHEERFLSCYADVRVNSYIVGTGPSQLPVLILHRRFHQTPGDVSRTQRDEVESVLIRGGFLPFLVYAPENGIVGREGILFLGPAYDFSQQVLEVVSTWGLEERDDDTVIAVHPNRYTWTFEENYESQFRSKVEIPLAQLSPERPSGSRPRDLLQMEGA